MEKKVVLEKCKDSGKAKPYEPPKVTELGDMADLTNYDVSVLVP